MSPLFPRSSSCVGRSLSRLFSDVRVLNIVVIMGARTSVVVVIPDVHYRAARRFHELVITGARTPVVVVIPDVRYRAARRFHELVITGARTPVVVVIPDVRYRAARRFHELVLAPGDGWKSNSGRNLAGIPVGVD